MKSLDMQHQKDRLQSLSNTFTVEQATARSRDKYASKTFKESERKFLQEVSTRRTEASLEDKSSRMGSTTYRPAFPQLVQSLMANPFSTHNTINNTNGHRYSHRQNKLNGEFERVNRRAKDRRYK